MIFPPMIDNPQFHQVVRICTVHRLSQQDGRTILMATHSAEAASHANRVLFIKDGQVFHQI